MIEATFPKLASVLESISSFEKAPNKFQTDDDAGV